MIWQEYILTLTTYSICLLHGKWLLAILKRNSMGKKSWLLCGNPSSFSPLEIAVANTWIYHMLFQEDFPCSAPQWKKDIVYLSLSERANWVTAMISAARKAEIIAVMLLFIQRQFFFPRTWDILPRKWSQFLLSLTETDTGIFLRVMLQLSFLSLVSVSKLEPNLL